MKQGRTGQWMRWFLFSEGLILLLALTGPGRRSGRRYIDNAFLARLFIEDPGYLEAVAVNFVAIHIFIGCAFLAAWIVTRLRRKG